MIGELNDSSKRLFINPNHCFMIIETALIIMCTHTLHVQIKTSTLLISNLAEYKTKFSPNLKD